MDQKRKLFLKDYITALVEDTRGHSEQGGTEDRTKAGIKKNLA